MVYVVQSYWACFGLYPSSCMWKTKNPTTFRRLDLFILPHPPEDGDRSSLRNVVVFCLPHTRRWIKSKTSPIALCYIIMLVYSVAACIDRLMIMWPVVTEYCVRFRCLCDSVSSLRIFISVISCSYSPLDPVLKSHIITTSCTSVFVVIIL
jgi:hypothetical protein